MGKLNDKPEPKIIDQSSITKNTKSLQAEAYKACKEKVADDRNTDAVAVIDVAVDLGLGAVLGVVAGGAIGAGIGEIGGAALGADIGADAGGVIGVGVVAVKEIQDIIDKKSNPDKVKEACADVRANPPTKSL